MPKFYVSSGDLNIALEGTKPQDAAIAAFKTMRESPVKQLGKLTVVSEHGFDSDCDEDTYFITGDLLEETDQLENFKAKEWID